MKYLTILAAAIAAAPQHAIAAALAPLAQRANTVVGAAEGFAKGVTGGGSAAAVFPTTNAELVSYLGDSQPRTIVLTKTFDFTGTEGTATMSGCAPYGTAAGCQLALNKDNWCTNLQSSAPTIASIKYDVAGMQGITVGSNKSLLGQGSSGIIKGKGLRIVSGVKNIIIQNIRITGINPQYVWGGDGITIDGFVYPFHLHGDFLWLTQKSHSSDMVWIDHVTTDLIGRQHLVFGNTASNRVTVSNCEINGVTSWSATCDGHHYFGLYFTGSSDLITLKNNYIHHTSGRSPKVAGNTLLHAVNNYFSENSKHAFEVAPGAKVLAEGNLFVNVVAAQEPPQPNTSYGQLFGSPSVSANAVCKASLGRNCEVNSYSNSGALTGTDSSFLTNFQGKNIAAAASVSGVSNVAKTAGYGKI